MRHLLLTTAAPIMFLLTGAAAGCAQQQPVAAMTAAQVEAARDALPSRADNFRLVTDQGRAFELYRMKDAKAIVLIMHGVDRSEIASMVPLLTKLQADYKGEGVEFAMVNSNVSDTRAAIRADVAKNKITVPVLQDDLQLVGEQLGATRVSETFVIDPKTWRIAYRGPLSAEAIKAVVIGQTPPSSAAAVGTQISFPNGTAARKAEFAKISYSQTIVPIIEDKCIACHQEGGIAPISFDGYEKIKTLAPMMREAIRTDRMPPWDPDPHVGTFKDDKSLSSEQIKTLVHWIEAGTPRGEGPDGLAGVKHEAPEWPLGKPDLVVDIPSYKVPATGVVDYQYPSIANPLKEGKWIKASTANVKSRRVVHHILSGVIPEGSEGGMDGGFGSQLGGYTVGMESVVQPKGMGVWIPAGGRFGYQMHYTPSGKETVAAEKVGLYFYKDDEKPILMMRENPIVDSFIEIPPNDPGHEEVAYFDFPKDAFLHTAIVHAHYRGTYSKLELMDPTGNRETILNVPFYDFNWQRMYEFDQPIPIRAGSKLIATYVYDNSKRNPANPDPNKKVVWGDQSFDEMFFTQLRYRWVDETAAKQTNYDDLMRKTALVGMLDDNINGKVERSELRGPFNDALNSDSKFNAADTNRDGGLNADELATVVSKMPGGAGQ